MDLSFLIPSKTRRLVLEFFAIDQEAQVYVNELARLLKIAPQMVYRELINLENWGFLFSSKRGNQRVYRVNPKFIYFKMIKEMIESRKKVLDHPPKISSVYEWRSLRKQYDKIPIPENLKIDLQSKRDRPRSYDEEKFLKRKGLL